MNTKICRFVMMLAVFFGSFAGVSPASAQIAFTTSAW
jgi:hypothetical protein